MGWLLNNLKLWLYGAGVAALAVAVALIRQSGADAEKMKQAKADLKAASTIGAARSEARGKSDADLDKEVDKWTRK